MAAIVCSDVKVFVGNLPFNATTQTLETLFKPFGDLVGAKIVLDRLTRKPRGFGFVTFSDKDAAEQALTLNGQKHADRSLTVRYAVARGTGSLKDDEDDEVGGRFTPVAVAASSAKPCKFHNSPAGCRSGARCKWSHSMTSWSGPASGLEFGVGRHAEGGGPRAATKAPPLAKKVQKSSPASTTDRAEDSTGVLAPSSAPPVAVAVAAERLAFITRKVVEDGLPSAAQLAAFLRTVVDALRSAIRDLPGASFDMVGDLGWNYASNRSVASSPPTVDAVVLWLKDPKFVPAPTPETAADFNKRSATSIRTLLDEYGAFDPDWKPEAKPPP